MFDLLVKPDVALTEKEKNDIKKMVRGLLETLKRETVGAGLAQKTAGHRPGAPGGAAGA